MKKLLLLIVILINIIIFNYIYNIEKEQCECSKTYIGKFVKYYAVVTIIIALYLILGIKYKIDVFLMVFEVRQCRWHINIYTMKACCLPVIAV